MKKLLQDSFNTLPRFLIVFILAPNLVIYGAAQLIDVTRPLLFADYLLAALPMMLLRTQFMKYVSAAVLSLLMTLDLLLTFLGKFNFDIEKLAAFLTPEVATTGFFGDIGASFFAHSPDLAKAMILTALAVVLAFNLLPRYAGGNFISIIIAAILLIPTGAAKLMIDPALLLEPDMKWGNMYSENFVATKFEGEFATKELLAQPDMAAKYDKVLLIAVESFGVLKDAEAQRILLEPLMELREHYNVEAGRFEFAGNTLEGEFRELCGIKLNSLTLPIAENVSLLNGCLPQLLARQGFDVVMMHNADGKYYDRVNWYNYFTPDKIYFADEIRKEFGLKPVCGTSYKGTCEKELITEALPKILTGKKFLHFMTVVSHMPVADDIAVNSSFSKKAAENGFFSESGNEETMKFSSLIYDTLEALAELALQMKDENIMIIVTGDHATPMIGSAGRNYQPNMVQYVRIQSK